MNKYTRIDTIHFKKYTPAFVKSYFMELHSMSKLKDVYIIKEMVIKNTILCFFFTTNSGTDLVISSRLINL